MAKNVRRWYGVISDVVLVSGNDREISAFRNACHRVVERDFPESHQRNFPNKKGDGVKFGSCKNLAEFKAFTSSNYGFKMDGAKVLLCRQGGGAEVVVHPTE